MISSKPLLGEEPEHLLTPEQIIYRQIERIHILRANKLSATESIFLLSDILSPLRTPEYEEQTKNLIDSLNDGTDTDEAFHKWYESLIELLSKNGYWLVQRRYLGWEE